MEELQRETRKQDRKRRLLSFGVGVLILLIALAKYAIKVSEQKGLPTVNALVVEAYDGPKSIWDRCTVEYTVDGQRYSHEFHEYYRKGNQITLCYEPEDPENVYLTNNRPALVLALFGFALILCGLWEERKIRSYFRD